MCFLFVTWKFIIPHFVTKNRIENAARIARAQDHPNGYCFEDKFDWWNNQICIKREKFEDGKLSGIVYQAFSAGRDGELNTKDDYENIKIDLNKSKMVGKYAKEKTVQFLNGWREKPNSKHDKP